MRYLLDSIERAAASGLLLPALISALTVPDVAVAATHADGHTSGPRYSAWVDLWFHRQVPHYREHLEIDGTALYAARCTLLMQGQSTPVRATGRARNPRVRRQICFARGGAAPGGDPAGVRTVGIDTLEFVRAMAAAGRAWLEQAAPAVQERIGALSTVRPDPTTSDGSAYVICVQY